MPTECLRQTELFNVANAIKKAEIVSPTLTKATLMVAQERPLTRCKRYSAWSAAIEGPTWVNFLSRSQRELLTGLSVGMILNLRSFQIVRDSVLGAFSVISEERGRSAAGGTAAEEAPVREDLHIASTRAA